MGWEEIGLFISSLARPFYDVRSWVCLGRASNLRAALGVTAHVYMELQRV